jgi:hypothetical protein
MEAAAVDEVIDDDTCDSEVDGFVDDVHVDCCVSLQFGYRYSLLLLYFSSFSFAREIVYNK